MNRRIALGEVLFSGIGSFSGIGALHILGAPVPQELIPASAVALWMVVLIILAES